MCTVNHRDRSINIAAGYGLNCQHSTPGRSKIFLWPRQSSNSSWLPTAEVRVRSWVWSSGICGAQRSAEAKFLRVLRFRLPIFISPNSPSSHSPGPGTIGQKWTQYGFHPPLPLCGLKKDFSLLHSVQIVSGAYPASYQMGNGGKATGP
jgi:hypothetical protein